MAAFTTAYAGWYVVMKRVWEAMSLWLLPALILMGVIMVGIVTHTTHLYHWNDAEAVANDAILTHKSGFLNIYWYIGGTIVFGGLWYFFADKMRSLSVGEDGNAVGDYRNHRIYKRYAAAFLPIAGFTSAFMIWLWVMSLDAHWYSTMFAWYATASWFVSMIALTIMMLIYLKSRGYFPNVTDEHLHDLGKYLFAFSIFWAYLWFSQYMLIWYANVGEETIYFRERLDNYRVLFYGILLVNLLLPFIILMSNKNKRKYGTLFFAALFVFLGHWVDFFQMIKPGVALSIREHNLHMDGGAHGTAVHGDDHALEAHGEDHGAMADHDGDHDDDLEQSDSDAEGHSADRASDPALLAMSEDHEHDENYHGESIAEDNDGYDPVDRSHTSGGKTEQEQDMSVLPIDRTEMAERPVSALAGQYRVNDGDEDEAHGAEIVPFKAGYTLPGFLEIGTFIGFLGGFLFFVLSKLQHSALRPKNDPYLVESEHHHV